MMKNRSLGLALVLSASSFGLFACGARDGSGGLLGDEGGNAATSADSEALSAAQEMSPSNVYIAPGEESPTAASTAETSDDGTTADPAYPLCHPHLFARGVEYARVLNAHLAMFVADVDTILALTPRVRAETTHSWEWKAGSGSSIEVTLTKSAPGVFSVTESVAARGSSTFTTVATGSVDRSDVDDVKKTLTFDLDALHAVIPAGAADKSRGTIAVAIERITSGSQVKQTVGYTLTDFEPMAGDPHGPRTGTVSFLREPGVGGAMIYSSSLVFFCPDNPSGLVADDDVYLRWYVKDDSVSGRADARATGGQFPAGNDWVGVSCRTATVAKASASDGTTTATLTDDGYWMIKEENASGATVAGTSIGDTSTADPACDPAFGPVTELADATSDPTLPATIPASGAFPGQY
jgi:hypothetical protein